MHTYIHTLYISAVTEILHNITLQVFLDGRYFISTQQMGLVYLRELQDNTAAW